MRVLAALVAVVLLTCVVLCASCKKSKPEDVPEEEIKSLEAMDQQAQDEGMFEKIKREDPTQPTEMTD